MRQSSKYIIFIGLSLLIGCASTETQKTENQKVTLLYAAREAPLGGLALELFSDSTFTLTRAGLRDADIYNGIFRLHYDTLFLSYNDSLPGVVGEELLIEKYNLRFLDMPGGLGITSSEIDLNELIEGKPIDSLELEEIRLMQGSWLHSKDEKAVVSIIQNFWADYYNDHPIDETDDYRIWWKRKLPEFADTTTESSSFIVLTNHTDTINFEILGLTDSTMSLMHFPSGHIHLYLKEK